MHTLPNYTIRWNPGGRINYTCSRLHLDIENVPVFRVRKSDGDPASLLQQC